MFAPRRRACDCSDSKCALCRGRKLGEFDLETAAQPIGYLPAVGSIGEIEVLTLFKFTTDDATHSRNLATVHLWTIAGVGNFGRVVVG